MTAGATAGAGAAGANAAAAIAQAIKASGVIVKLEPDSFQDVLSRIEDPLVVVAEGGFFNTNYQYLTSYKGLAFFTKSRTQLMLPADCEVVESQKIWIPG